jgi:hypothetical protein
MPRHALHHGVVLAGTGHRTNLLDNGTSSVGLSACRAIFRSYRRVIDDDDK